MILSIVIARSLSIITIASSIIVIIIIIIILNLMIITGDDFFGRSSSRVIVLRVLGRLLLVVQPIVIILTDARLDVKSIFTSSIALNCCVIIFLYRWTVSRWYVAVVRVV